MAKWRTLNFGRNPLARRPAAAWRKLPCGAETADVFDPFCKGDSWVFFEFLGHSRCPYEVGPQWLKEETALVPAGPNAGHSSDASSEASSVSFPSFFRQVHRYFLESGNSMQCCNVESMDRVPN